jgi:DNA replication and repair protein RecF
MKIAEITLTNFRTYQKQFLTLHDGVHLLVGENGAGKTNFLEAVYVLGLARSYKGEDQDLIRHEEAFTKIEAVVKSGGREKTMAIIVSELGKKAMVGGSEIRRLSDYIGLLDIVAFTPDSLQLVKGSPVERRYFLDLFLGQSDKAYMNALASFKHVLKQRNELLKSFALTKKYDELFLDVLDAQFEAAATQIVAKRAAFLKEVAVYADQAFMVLTGRQNELALQYRPSVESDFKTSLQGRLKSDLNQGATGLGPHRDDFDILLQGRSAKDFASQGEQRLIVLALTMAMVDYLDSKTQETPVLLLDDVFSELDHEKQNRLVRHLNRLGAQVVITTTSLSDLAPSAISGSRRYTVTKGRIREDITHAN